MFQSEYDAVLEQRLRQIVDEFAIASDRGATRVGAMFSLTLGESGMSAVHAFVKRFDLEASVGIRKSDPEAALRLVVDAKAPATWSELERERQSLMARYAARHLQGDLRK